MYEIAGLSYTGGFNMEFVKDFASQYGLLILQSTITFIIGYVGTYIKKYIDNAENNKIKKEVCITCVKAVEQLYTDLHGEEKLQKCTEAMTEMLNERGIQITELEINMLIHSTLADLNKLFDDVFGEEAPIVV